MSLRRVLAALAGLLLTACSLLAPPDQLAAPEQRIAAPPGYYGSVAWLPSNWLVVHYEPVPRKREYKLYRLRPDGTDFAQLPLGEDRPADSRALFNRMRSRWAARIPEGLSG